MILKESEHGLGMSGTGKSCSAIIGGPNQKFQSAELERPSHTNGVWFEHVPRAITHASFIRAHDG